VPLCVFSFGGVSCDSLYVSSSHDFILMYCFPWLNLLPLPIGLCLLLGYSIVHWLIVLSDGLHRVGSTASFNAETGQVIPLNIYCFIQWAVYKESTHIAILNHCHKTFTTTLQKCHFKELIF
jgi:hypothetical protein